MVDVKCRYGAEQVVVLQPRSEFVVLGVSWVNFHFAVGGVSERVSHGSPLKPLFLPFMSTG